MKTKTSGSRIRRLAAGGAAAVTLMLAAGMAQGQAGSDISVTVNGQPVLFQGLGPQQINGRTMVPVRGVLEKLGANISYNNATQTVTASTPTIDIQLKIGARTAIVNATRVTLDVPAQSIQDHTFVPLRFLGEALGADLKWNAATRTVVITTKDAIPSDIAGLDTTDRRGDRDRNHDRRPDRPRDTDVPVRNAPAPVIDSFTQTSGKWLRAGETLQATLEGTPGGEASFRVPGLAEDIPMRETRPGHYVGSWQVPENKPMQLRSAAVIASLRVGENVAPLLQASQSVSVDAIPPRARDMAPQNNAIVSDLRPNISAAFEDRGSGIDQAAVHLVLDSDDVTNQATVTRDFISFRPARPLRPGMHEVELRLADMAGNLRNTSWVFKVQPREEGGIRSVTEGFDRALQPGDTLRLELTGSPGGRATFSSGNIMDVPMREDQPGHYVAEYTIRRGDEVSGQPIAYRLAMPDGQRFEQASARSLRIAAGRPLPPTITSPAPNAAPSNPMIVAGRAAPHARVAVRVDYRNRVLGLVALQGTAADTIVTADKNGNWETEPINVGGLFRSRGLEYTITATTLNAADEKSEPAILRYKAQ